MEILNTVVVSSAAGVILNRLGIELGKYTNRIHERKRREDSRKADAADMRSAALTKDEIERERLGRAAAHLYWQEGNLEEISFKAISLIPNDTPASNAENLDAAWLSVFRDNAKHSPDDEAQEMWAKVLAGETTTPETFSKQTLNTLGMMSRDEAQTFAKLCNLRIKGLPDSILIFEFESDFIRSLRIERNQVMLLHELGLLTGIQLAGYLQTRVAGKPVRAEFAAGAITVTPTSSHGGSTGNLHMGLCALTHLGRELATLTESYEAPGLRDYVAAKWADDGHTIDGL